MRVNNTRVLKIAKFSALGVLIVFIIGFCVYKLVGIKKSIYNLGTNNPNPNLEISSKWHGSDESDIDSSLRTNFMNDNSEFKSENQNYDYPTDNNSMDNRTIPTNGPGNRQKQINAYKSSEQLSQVEEDEGYGSSNSLNSFNSDEKGQNIPSSVQTPPYTSSHNPNYIQQPYNTEPYTNSHKSQPNVTHISQEHDTSLFELQNKQTQKNSEFRQNRPDVQPIEFSVYKDEYRKFESYKPEYIKGYSLLFNESADLDANYQNSSNDYNEDEDNEDLSDFSTYTSLLDSLKAPDSEPKEHKNSVIFNMQNVSYDDVSTAISKNGFKVFTENYNKLQHAYMFSKFSKIANNLKDSCKKTNDTLDKCVQMILSNIDQQ
ncbi:hypothetical protein NEAUS03_2205, partial [Nematocida ausubeli]